MRFIIAFFVSLFFSAHLFSQATVYPGGYVLPTLQEAYDAIPLNATVAYTIKLSGIVPVSQNRYQAQTILWNKSNITVTSEDVTNMATVKRSADDSYNTDLFIRLGPATTNVKFEYLIFTDAAKALDLDGVGHTIYKCKFFIDEFIVEGGGGVIAVAGGSDHNVSENDIVFNSEAVLDRCFFDHNASKTSSFDLYHGIYLSVCENTTIFKNTIINAPGAGIHMYGKPNLTNNTITQNTIRKCNTHNYKIKDHWIPASQPIPADYVKVDNTRFGILVGVQDPGVPANIVGQEIKYNSLSSSSSFAATRSSYYFENPGQSGSGYNDIIIRTGIDRTKVGYNSFGTWSSNTCVTNGLAEYAQRFFPNYNGSNVSIYEFVPGELLVVIKDKGIILKFDANMDPKHGLFDIKVTNNKYQPLPGSKLKGSQVFASKRIVDLIYAEGKMLIAFDDRKILKLTGTGGDILDNMFNIQETTDGFAHLSGTQYYVGHHQFNTEHRILDLMYYSNGSSGYTFISFISADGLKGDVLKVNGTGGTQANLFAIDEVIGNSEYGFKRRGTYVHYAGDAKFNSPVIRMEQVQGETFFCFKDNRVLKISGHGGSEHNMLAVIETTDGFTSSPGYNYYIGHAKFMSTVTNVTYAGGNSYFSFYNGKILKISGTGGNQADMFRIEEDANKFSADAGTSYYVGDFKCMNYHFDGSTKQEYVTDILYYSDRLLFAFNTGKLLLVDPAKAIGNNMFGVSEPGHYFWDDRKDGTYLGTSSFHSTVSDISLVGNKLYIALMNGKIFRAKAIINGGVDMFYARENSFDFSRLRTNGADPANDVWQGDQNLLLKNLPVSNTRLATDGIQDVQTFDETRDHTIVFPNPTANGQFTVHSTLPNAKVDVIDMTGTVLLRGNCVNGDKTFSMAGHCTGIYIVRVSNNTDVEYKKIIYQR